MVQPTRCFQLICKFAEQLGIQRGFKSGWFALVSGFRKSLSTPDLQFNPGLHFIVHT